MIVFPGDVVPSLQRIWLAAVLFFPFSAPDAVSGATSLFVLAARPEGAPNPGTNELLSSLFRSSFVCLYWSLTQLIVLLKGNY